MFDFIADNYLLLIMLIGLLMITFFDVFLEKAMLLRIRSCVVALFVLGTVDCIEEWTATFDKPTVLRILCSAIGYSLRPLIVMMLIFVIYKQINKLIIIPSLINIPIAFSALFTDISYSYDAANEFRRGPLGYTPFIVGLFYLAVLFFVTFRIFSKNSQIDGIVVLFISLNGMLAILLSSFFNRKEIFNPVFAADIIMYYLYIYAQYTKRDALTGLYNRQAFYSEIGKPKHNITGMISIDMNELKWINDTLGHVEGDKAIKTVSDCFTRTGSGKDKVYRLGGDEFVVVCFDRKPEETLKLAEKMREAVSMTDYTCAFGVSVGKEPEEMLKEADSLMYADKARIKAERAAAGKAVHSRS